jgi:hypothetical protein
MSRAPDDRRQEYRRYAAECLALAQRAENPVDRSRLLEMAQAFNELAAKMPDKAVPDDDLGPK